MSGDYPQYIEHDKVVPPQLLMAYNPMKTSSVYHQQKPEWNWTYFHQLSDLAHWGTTLYTSFIGLI